MQREGRGQSHSWLHAPRAPCFATRRPRRARRGSHLQQEFVEVVLGCSQTSRSALAPKSTRSGGRLFIHNRPTSDRDRSKNRRGRAMWAFGRRLPLLIAILTLTGIVPALISVPASAQEDLDKDKSGAQLFA